MENKCVCCGADIPEGRQVCPNCESAKIEAYEALQRHYEAKAKRLEEMQGKTKERGEGFKKVGKNKITVEVETVGCEFARKQIRRLNDELRETKRLARALGLKKRDIRKLITVKVEKGKRSEQNYIQHERNKMQKH